MSQNGPVHHRFFALSIALAMLTVSLFLGSGMLSASHAEPGPTELNDGVWGSIETFDQVTTGTQGSFGDVALYPNGNCDAVVLNGRVWLMYRGNESRMVAQYTPTVSASAWNLSFEAFAPRELSSYTRVGQQPGVYAVKALLNDSTGSLVCGIELRVSEEGTQGIYCYDPSTFLWDKVADRIVPALVHRYDDFGLTPERYVVSFAYDGSGSVQVTVGHTGGAVLFTRNVAMPGTSPTPVLRFYDNIGIPNLGTTSYGINGGWMLDDFGVRSTATRYAFVEPAYEYVPKDSPAWLIVQDRSGVAIGDAVVTIGGQAATFDLIEGRYEAMYDREVDWAVPTDYVVNLDGGEMRGRLELTTVQSDPLASIPKWWNGREWATVFGLDDCNGPASALNHYWDYDHPTTAYVMGTEGNSSEVLATQSEIGLHLPHDYTTWMKKSWTESVDAATSGQDAFSSVYNYSSRWDDPDYVGDGDSYISMANPGNSATYQMMYAQYAAGMRIEGIGSNLYNGVPGNSSLMGCYWVWGSEIDPYVAWDPVSPYDLMDASRQWNTDNPGQTYERVKVIAERGGLLRVYAHPGYSIKDAEILHWIDDDKTNYTFENWKATDGEAASYTYGRWTTDVLRNEGLSDDDTMVFDVSRQDPKAAGYWLVPVTIAIDIGGMDVKRVEVVEGGHTYSSDGAGDYALRDLGGERVMDLGYDIRGQTLYVSHFWNSSAQLRVVFNYTNPMISGTPEEEGEIGVAYSFNATATPASTGSNSWTLDNSSATWLSMVSNTQTSCALGGTPTAPGNYSVYLSVQDGDSVSTMSWTVSVPEKIPPMLLTTPKTQVLERNGYSYQAVCDQEVDDWTLSGNATWLTLSSTGHLSGTPEKADVGHAYDVSIMVKNRNGTSYQNFSVQVINLQPQIITVPSFQIKSGESYEYLPATNEDAFGVLWTGLITNASFPYQFNGTSGEVTFLATIAGTFAFQLTVSDQTGTANQTAVQDWTVTVLPAPTPKILGVPVLVAVEDEPYSCDFSSDQALDSWNLETDADWLSISSEGTVFGTPSNLNSNRAYYAHVTGVNANGSSDLNYTIGVINVAPSFITVPPLIGEVGSPYGYTAMIDDQDGGFFVIMTTNLSFQYHFDASNGTVWFTPTQPGDFWISILADDGSGSSNSSAKQNWTVHVPVPPVIDFTPPQTVRDVNGTAMGGWYAASVTVALTAWDDVTGVNQTLYRLDGGEWTVYLGPIAIDTEGDHLLEYRSVDLAGNYEETIALDVSIDLGAPTTQVESVFGESGDNGWYRSQVDVVLNATDEWSGLDKTYVQMDDGEWVETSSPTRISTEGTHELNYYSIDRAGNVEEVRSLTIKVDTIDPISSLVLAGPSPSLGYYNGSVNVNITSLDEGSRTATIFLNVDGGGWIPYYGGFQLATEGAHSIDHYSVDVAGNVGNTGSSSFVIDMTAPVTNAQISGEEGDDGWYVGVVTVTVNAEDATSGVWWSSYRLDQEQWAEVDDEIAVALEGEHSFQYRSLDRCSNLEQTRALSFKIDASAPTISLDIEDGAVLTSSSMSLNWTSSDATSGIDHYALIIDGGTPMLYEEAGCQLEGLAVGEHTVEVKAYDVAGNVATDSVTITVDTSPFSPSSSSGMMIWIGLAVGAAAIVLIGAVLYLRKKN